MAIPAPVRSGLCISLPTSKIKPEIPHVESGTVHKHQQASVATIPRETSGTVEQSLTRTHSDDFLCRPLHPDLSLPLRSLGGMEGLHLAESGDGLVELDPLGGGSGFKQGTRVLPGLVTPRGGAFANPSASAQYEDGQPLTLSEAASSKQQLSRSGTFLSEGVTLARNSDELKCLLGSSRSKIKSGAKIPPNSNILAHEDLTKMGTPAVPLEQGKSRAQVEVDILLDSEIYVEGCYLTGKLHVKVRKQGTQDLPVFLTRGKLRVIGFEGIPDNNERYTFYQHTAPLSAISVLSHVLYTSPPDEGHFSSAREGTHIIPFAMKLPVSDGIYVGAKGPFDNHSGAIVKYIVIASFKLKDNTTSKPSLAHFYRKCEIYPYLNASVILAPATRPLLATAARNVFLGGTGKLKLTAALHRKFWLAGQRCCVGIAVHNESKKAVKGVILSLIRTITIFRPHPDLDVTSRSYADPDACQTRTTRKLVAETTLEAGQRGLRGYVTEKGWWTGVEPGAKTEFSHFILLPHNALSIMRSRLLEVQYVIRVSIVAGSLSSEVSVTLPLRIVNHISVDPPPSFPTLLDQPGIPMPVPPLPVPISESIILAPLSHLERTMHEDTREKARGKGLASVFNVPDTRDLGYPSGVSATAVLTMPGSLSRIQLSGLTESLNSGASTKPHPENFHVMNEDFVGLQEVRECRHEDDYHDGPEGGTKRLDRENADDVLENNAKNSDEEVDCCVGSAGLKFGHEDSAIRFRDLQIGDESEMLLVHQKLVEFPRASTVPSREGQQAKKSTPNESQAVRDMFIPIAHSRIIQRSRNPQSSPAFVQFTRPSVKSTASSPVQETSQANTSGRTKCNRFSYPQESIIPPRQRSRFSRRVDSLIAGRCADAKVATASLSLDSPDRDRTRQLSTDGTGPQMGNPLFEVPPISLEQLISTTPQFPRTNSLLPFKTLTSRTTGKSVRSRVAELEHAYRNVSTSDDQPVSG